MVRTKSTEPWLIVWVVPFGDSSWGQWPRWTPSFREQRVTTDISLVASTSACKQLNKLSAGLTVGLSGDSGLPVAARCPAKLSFRKCFPVLCDKDESTLVENVHTYTIRTLQGAGLRHMVCPHTHMRSGLFSCWHHRHTGTVSDGSPPLFLSLGPPCTQITEPLTQDNS